MTHPKYPHYKPGAAKIRTGGARNLLRGYLGILDPKCATCRTNRADVFRSGKAEGGKAQKTRPQSHGVPFGFIVFSSAPICDIRG